MQFPFRIIESRVSRRDEFDMTDGCQPTHAFFYLKKGSFHIEIDGEQEELRAGDCLILPDYLHFRRNVIDPIEFVYVKFAYNPGCPYSFNIPHGRVTFEDQQRFHNNITIIEQLMLCDDIVSANYCEHLLIDILFQASFDQQKIHIHPDEQLPHNALVACAVTYVRENIGRKISVEDICNAVGTNSSTLNFNFRREIDMSVGQFVMSEKMKKARQLLTRTTYSISEIASRCGFDNVYYFSNAFKKIHGISPSEYRW